jgi:hypothetical protein
VAEGHEDHRRVRHQARRADAPHQRLAPVYTAAMAQGFDKQDTAAVCAVLEAMAGLKR